MERPAPSIADVAPAALDWVLKRCLEKDPDDRRQTARDLKAELERVAGGSSEVTTAPALVARHRILPWIVATVLALAAIPLGYMAYRHNTEEATRVLRFTVPPPEKGDFGAQGLPQLSPDGRRIAYTARIF